MRTKALVFERVSGPPEVCPKANCGGTLFIPHEDGWQCWNCMKIIYSEKPLPDLDADREDSHGS